MAEKVGGKAAAEASQAVDEDRKKQSVQERSTSHRRRQVAALRIRGYTLDEICRTLENLGIVNPESGNPYSRTVVHKDIQYISTQWVKDARKSNAEHRGKLLAESGELKRRVWQELGSDIRNARIIVDLMKFEASIYGINQPFKVQIEDNRAEQVKLDVAQLAKDMTVEQLRLFRLMRDSAMKQEAVSVESFNSGENAQQLLTEN